MQLLSCRVSTVAAAGPRKSVQGVRPGGRRQAVFDRHQSHGPRGVVSVSAGPDDGPPKNVGGYDPAGAPDIWDSPLVGVAVQARHSAEAQNRSSQSNPRLAAGGSVIP